MTALLTLAKSLGIDPGPLNQTELQEQTCSTAMTQITELAAKVERLSDVLANFYDYTHCERMSTDGAVTYSTSAINHHAFMALNAINETPSAALETLKAQRQADNAGFVRLALELCDAVESMTGLPPVKRAMRFGRLVNSIRQRAQEDGHESTRS